MPVADRKTWLSMEDKTKSLILGVANKKQKETITDFTKAQKDINKKKFASKAPRDNNGRFRRTTNVHEQQSEEDESSEPAEEQRESIQASTHAQKNRAAGELLRAAIAKNYSNEAVQANVAELLSDNMAMRPKIRANVHQHEHLQASPSFDDSSFLNFGDQEDDQIHSFQHDLIQFSSDDEEEPERVTHNINMARVDGGSAKEDPRNHDDLLEGLAAQLYIQDAPSVHQESLLMNTPANRVANNVSLLFPKQRTTSRKHTMK